MNGNGASRSTRWRNAAGGGGGADWVADVKAKATITDVAARYTELKRAGSSWRGPCPIHKGTDPNFAVSPDRGTFKCFSCGEGGDAIALVAVMENLFRNGKPDFIAVWKVLAGWYGVEVPEYRSVRPKSDAEKLRALRQTTQQVEVDRAAWGRIGLAGVIASSSLGSMPAPDGPVLTIPIPPGGETPLGWARYRLVEDAAGVARPESLGLAPESAPEAAGQLVTSDAFRAAARGADVWVVDEPIAVLLLAQAGVSAVCAPAAGFAAEGLSNEHVRRLAEHGATRVYLFVPTGGTREERDARLRAVFASEPRLLARGIEPVLILPPADSDPAHPAHRSSWEWFCALDAKAEALEAMAADNQCAVDCFQLRVAQLAQRVFRTPAAMSLDEALEKVGPSLKAVEDCGDRVLYHSYMAWAQRAFRLSSRGQLHAKIRPKSAGADEAEEF